MFLNKEKFYHAYLLEGEKEYIFPKLLNFLEKDLNFNTSSNPDFYLANFNTFGIDDGRIIKNFQSKKPIAGDKQIIIIQTNFITNEAQNSLLKMFEEPTKNTHIFLIIHSSEELLPTLKSRFQIIKFLNDKNLEMELLVKDFLKSNISEKHKLLKRFSEHKKDEPADKAGAIQFLNNLEKILYEKYKKDFKKLPLNFDFENIFSEIIQGRSYLSGRSPSVKMILEHISQIIPKLD